MKLAYTRKIIDAIHNGSLLNASYSPTPIFNLQVPDAVEGVPSEILHPENSVSIASAAAVLCCWPCVLRRAVRALDLLFIQAYLCIHKHLSLFRGGVPSMQWADKAAYSATLKKLGQLFVANFEKFADQSTKQILEAGPVLA